MTLREIFISAFLQFIFSPVVSSEGSSNIMQFLSIHYQTKYSVKVCETYNLPDK